MRQNIENNPLKLGDTVLKENSEYSYLGDIIHMDGLSSSIFATIKKREGRSIAAINEINTIIEDCRMKSIGGALAGLEIWELALVPSILTNADTWLEIDEESIKALDNLQYTMCRYLLNTPRSTAKPFLLWDLGLLKMENRIIMKKLNLYHHIINLPNKDLANEIINLQI